MQALPFGKRDGSNPVQREGDRTGHLVTHETTLAGRIRCGCPSRTHLPLWRECFGAIEIALLHVAPVYYGLGVPRGDGSAIIVVPGFFMTEAYLTPLRAWLRRIDYRTYLSDIGRNTDCPDLLIRRKLNAVIDRARAETGRRVHLIGHSLGGMIALAAAANRAEDVASVITLGSPFTGNAAHPVILRMADYVRSEIRSRNGGSVSEACYTCHCDCSFATSVKQCLPEAVGMTAIYSRTDSVVDWRSCMTGDPALDCEIPGTHMGMVINPSVYSVIAQRLAAAAASQPPRVQ